MSLNAELNAVADSFYSRGGPIVDTIRGSVVDLKSKFDPSSCSFHSSIIFPSQIKITILIYKPKESIIHVGDTLPSFDLTDAVGKPVSSADLLAKGPILITFYRGSWCPFCNLALKALQKHLDEFQAKGVSLVAISPELPDTALSTMEKNELKFQVLSDVGHKYARQLGIVWQMPDNLRPVFEKLGHDLITRNGDDSFEVPIPATLLVDGKGVVKKTYIEPEYTKRVEPDTVLEWINAL
jgi:peroxiredoxin